MEKIAKKEIIKEEIIKVENLSFTYGNEPVLEAVNFSISTGDFTAIIGSNGSGKSTLVKLLLGLLQPSSGSINIFGEKVDKFRKRPEISYIPQNVIALISNFPATVEEIVNTNLYSQVGFMRLPKKRHLEKAWHALELVGMEAYAKRPVSDLSGGQQQRVMIARALAGQPKVMILDEPTTGIDRKSSESLYQLLGQLNKNNGLTVIMVTHDIARVSNYADRIFCLEEGSIVELGSKQIEDELMHKHKHPVKPIEKINENQNESENQNENPNENSNKNSNENLNKNLNKNLIKNSIENTIGKGAESGESKNGNI